MTAKPTKSEAERAAWLRAKNEEVAARVGDAQLALELHLPMWGDSLRAVPNGILRSSLFGAVGRGEYADLKNEEMAAVAGVKIIYTGARLDQDHLTLWEALVHAARMQQLGDRCVVSAYQLLKLMGKPDSGSNYKQLTTMLNDLTASNVQIFQGQYRFWGSLVTGGMEDTKSKRIAISLNPAMVKLYCSDQFTLKSVAVRTGIKKPLGKWLHGFYSTHANPYPYTIETLHRLCGSCDKSLRNFTATLKRALEEVATVSAANGEFFFFAIKDKKLYVTRDPNKLIHFDTPSRASGKGAGPETGDFFK